MYSRRCRASGTESQGRRIPDCATAFEIRSARLEAFENLPVLDAYHRKTCTISRVRISSHFEAFDAGNEDVNHEANSVPGRLKSDVERIGMFFGLRAHPGPLGVRRWDDG